MPSDRAGSTRCRSCGQRPVVSKRSRMCAAHWQQAHPDLPVPDHLTSCEDLCLDECIGACGV